MTSRQIRDTFLEFFEKKGHKIVESAPLVMKNDPSLMFTNAGMNQFKEIFLGNTRPAALRVADTQKCLRVSGKHNDLDEVGIDTYHHTFFEMLGNWSFGDYFKKEAISWAWELLTEVYRLDTNNLYVTVFEGDASQGLEADTEAAGFWREFLPEERIIGGNRKDNFWEMGETGPCGPCSEIHIDLRDAAEKAKHAGASLVNTGHPQVIEVWNLVFMQFNRLADQSLEALPQRHVDTGMGFERLCMALQNKQSNYDTDVFQPLIRFISEAVKIPYGAGIETDVAMRVMADHVRAIAFSIADGQLPSGTGAGYVIRRILRRAVRYGYTFLSLREPFLFQLTEVLARQFQGVFLNFADQKNFISRVIEEEENSFLRTLETGIAKFEKYAGGKSVIAGDFAFELYDTYGFPPDLTALMAREKGMELDLQTFQAELEKQRERARKAGHVEAGDWILISEDVEQPVFTGYDELRSQAKIVKYRRVTQKGQNLYQLVFDRSPFYAEGGGQVGDRGEIKSEGLTIRVLDTRMENNQRVHMTESLPGHLNGPLELVVDVALRARTEEAHTATHLLQAALRQVLGSHVQQKGSRVDENGLRFDFAHFSKLTEDEIRQVEDIVNTRIRQDIPLVEVRNMPYQAAVEKGATALFGEKYGDFVRLVTFSEDFSMELCGGTHVSSSGRLGLFKITSESAVAAGIRRIEALTGEHAFSWFREQSRMLGEIRALLKGSKDPVKALDQLVLENQEARKELEKFDRLQIAREKELVHQSLVAGPVCLVVRHTALSHADSIKSLSFELKNEIPNLVLVLAAVIQGKPFLSIVISDKLVKENAYNAVNWIRQIAPAISGGGGGQAFYATAGGQNAGGIPEALRLAADFIN